MSTVENQLWEEGRIKKVCEEGEEGSFYRRRWQPPLRGGNPLFMVVTPILILHDIHAN
jgi:hypothetical protein